MGINVCEVGSVFKSTKKLTYLSTNTFLDYDAVILSLNSPGIFGNFNRQNKALYEKRKETLIEFIQHKKIPLIVFAPEPEEIHFISQGPTQLDFFIPGGNFSVEKETGEGKEIIPKTIFFEFLKKYFNNFHYNSYFKSFTGTPILNTPHTKRVLSYYNDNVIFLPALRNTLNENEFLSDLINLASQIKKKAGKIELPEWAKNYYLPNEKEIHSEVLNIESQIENLSKSLNAKKEYAETFGFRKQIFTGQGIILEEEIKKIFIEMGFESLEVEPNRDDLILRYGERVAVVEIKGLNSSAGEKHSNQLEKWVSLYFEKKEIRPKGILIVNSFKDAPLILRNEPTFPDQMLKYSISREHCLINSLQFIGLYYKVMKSENKDVLINTLFECIGVYKGFENWNQFIEKV